MGVNDYILARIKELKTAVAEHVIQASARKRSWRVGVLQSLIDGGLALIEARKVTYADQMAEGRSIQRGAGAGAGACPTIR